MLNLFGKLRTSIEQGNLSKIIRLFFLLVFLTISIQIILSLLLLFLYPIEGEPEIESPSIIDFFGMVMFAPAIETAVIAIAAIIYFRLFNNKIIFSILNAAIWGFLHSLLFWHSILSAAFAFFVLSYIYADLREISWKTGFLYSAAAHAFINLIAFIIMSFPI